MKSQRIIFLVLFALFCVNANCEYYTSVESLHDLLEAEIRVVSLFEEYMEAMEKISRQVNKTLNKFALLSKKADIDPEEFYANPLEAYKIISRFIIDWKKVNKAIFDETPATTYISKLKSLGDKHDLTLPTVNDLVGASKGLARLQRTYEQETTDVADGYLMGTNYAAEMTASECYSLGRSLFEAGNYKYAAEWLLQARIRLVAELKASNGTQQFGQITDVQVLQTLAPTMYHLGKSKLALLFNDELLSQDPTNPFGLQNMALYSNKALEERHAKSLEDNKGQQPTELEELFEEICNGNLQQTPHEKRKLRCRYVHNNVPFRFIAPFKKEELNHDPPVAYYHEFISENEIDRILNETQDSVERSFVGSVDMPIYTDERTSQTALLNFTDHVFLNNIAQRLKDVTGLVLETGEPLQVANYGIGGHFGPHYDFAEDPGDDFQGRGNRILTALMYINDVEVGGATAFLYLKLAVQPIKRSMLVFDNLHKSLELDYRTKHGGCPVLVGSKWICNEWFHEASQEFTRPCGLERDGYKSLQFKDLH